MNISLNGIKKSFDKNLVLNGVDIDIKQGEFVTLVGASGCGKSTLLRILAGLESADEGRVTVAGKDMTSVRPADRNLAMVFQSYALYPHLSVAENMATPLRLRNLPWHTKLPIIGPLLHRQRHLEIQRQVELAADVLKISHLLKRKPGQLSGGQRQRAALGRALVRQPAAFLMDEPLSNLDAALRVHMRAEISELHRRLGTTFVYVTHDQSEALTMSDRMAVMEGGRILQYGPPEEIYNNPLTIDVAKFVGSPPINLLTGELNNTGDVVLHGCTVGKLTSPVKSIQLGCRSENVYLSITGIDAVVTHRENLGSDVFLHTTLTQTQERVVVRAPSGTKERINDSVKLAFDHTQVMAFDEDGQRVYLVTDDSVVYDRDQITNSRQSATDTAQAVPSADGTQVTSH